MPENNGVVETEVGECWGTKCQEECKCGGDKRRCDFYEHVRNEANVYKCPIKTEILKQLIFDCATDLQYGNKTKDEVVNKLLALSNAKIDNN